VIHHSTLKEFMDKTPWQIVPTLADRGIYIASEATFYRVLKEEKMLAHRGRSAPKTSTPPAPLIATKPNQIWSWDITYLKSAVNGKYYYLYLIMDIFSRKIVGYKVHDCECMELSSELIRATCIDEMITEHQITLHSDNGGPMKGSTMLATLYMLGIVSSFSRPGVSDDNPFSESLFKTLKYCPKYPANAFDSIEAAIKWVTEFVYWYNNVHLHSGIKFVTPNDRHNRNDKKILEKRTRIYLQAKEKNPNRWSKDIRNWSVVVEVKLNPLRSKEKEDKKMAA
jgi:putative transposase